MSEQVDEAPKLIGDEETPKLTCGFCRKGVEAKDVCGKLWNDPVKGCTAHQRCMQYSAGLAQYTMKRFGGFKVAKVLKEQCRGKRLKCFICSSTKMKKRHSSCGAATAGCAWHKCRKTFHFYCARKNSGPVACKMVEIRENGEKIDHYCVFCSEEHKLLFTKKLKNPVQNATDTDDEAYKTDISSSSDSDESEDESSVESVEKPDATQKRPRLTSSESLDSIGKSGDERVNNVVTANRSDKKENYVTGSVSADEKSKAVVKRKCNGDEDLVNAKRSKVESASSDDDSGNATSELVICFVEQAERVNGPVKEALERAARTRFNLPPKRVFVWQYNGQRLSSEHFVYLLNEIGKALVNRDYATVSRLVFRMQLSDIAEFDKKISHNSTLNVNARGALYRGIRQQIARNFKKATEQSDRRVCSYCRIESDGYNEEVAFVLITEEFMPLQENLETSDEDEQEKKDTAKNVKAKGKESSPSGTHCSTSKMEKKSGEESDKILGTVSKKEKTSKASEKYLEKVANGKQSCKVKKRDEPRHAEHRDKKKTDLVNSKSQSVNKIIDAGDRSVDVSNENRNEKQKSHDKEKDPTKTKVLRRKNLVRKRKVSIQRKVLTKRQVAK